jgi:hypothetical protein
MDTLGLLIHEILPLLRQFCIAPYGIAVGGSYAKGSNDTLSDLDVYLFAQQVLPSLQRKALVMETLGTQSEATSWGCDSLFVEGGTDFLHGGRRVECWLRNSQEVERTIASCRKGQIRRDHVTWVTMGFFNYVVLGDVRTMQIVEDPQGILTGWKGDVATYPEPLRQTILHRFMLEAAFWPENFHYRSAIERADAIYTSGIVQQVLQALVQVIFALNHEYFPGEKKLAQALGKLSVQPTACPVRLQALLFPGKNPSVKQLQEQHRELGALVTEVQQLVLVYGATP